MERAAALFASVWGTSGISTPLPHDSLSGIHHAGGSVLGAFRDDALVGAAVAVAGAPRSTELYGMLAGVAPGTQSRGVGAALKLAQRVWGLRAGARMMRWTYDPLLRGNAVLNLNRLGATGTAFTADFYAPIPDDLNAGTPADRLVVLWDLERPPTHEYVAPDVGPALDVLVRVDDGMPVVQHAALERGADPGTPIRVALPDDIVAFRHDHPEVASAWIDAYRAVLPTLFRRGLVAVGVEAGRAYRFERRPHGGRGCA